MYRNNKNFPPIPTENAPETSHLTTRKLYEDRSFVSRPFQTIPETSMLTKTRAREGNHQTFLHTEQRFPSITTEREASIQGLRKTTDDLLEFSDPNYDEQIALFNSSRAPPKKRLSPRMRNRRKYTKKENRPNQQNIEKKRPNFQDLNKLHFRPTYHTKSAAALDTVPANSEAPISSQRNQTTRTAASSDKRFNLDPRPPIPLQSPKRDLNIFRVPLKKRQLPMLRRHGKLLSPLARVSNLPKKIKPSQNTLPFSTAPPMLRQNSSAFIAPVSSMLRRNSSTLGFYAHHSLVPPQLQLTFSRGQRLIADPLMTTPGSEQVPEPSNSFFAPTNAEPFNMDIANYMPNMDLLQSRMTFDHPFFHLQPTEQPIAPQLWTGFQLNRYSATIGHNNPVTFQSTDLFDNNSESNSTTKNDNKRMAESQPASLSNSFPLTKKPCKCGTSRCLKLYCDCFRSGLFCDSRICRCTDCYNDISHNQPHGDRQLAIKKILARRPHAFDVRIKRKRTGKGCGCTKTGCIKKYCECFAQGKVCSEHCACEHCLNRSQTNQMSVATQASQLSIAVPTK